jgi:YhgE/Pip-like protein
MNFFLQIAFIVRNETSYLFRSPQKLFSCALLVFVPAMYSILYITSVWDPETKTKALPVAVVNLDNGVQFLGHKVNVGWEIATRLEDSGRFGFVMSSDEQRARDMVRHGTLAFAVIIPRDFSARSVPGAEAGAGKIVIYSSQGNNFEMAAIAKHFAETLGSQINGNLNERRWAFVLHNAASSQSNVELLHDMVDKLRANASNLMSASQKTNQSVRRLTTDIELLAKALPDKTDSMSGSAEGLANSVETVVELDAPVENSGSGFASNVIPGALWLGAAMAVFFIHILVLPRDTQFFSRPVKVFGKIFLPACLAFLQSLLVFIAAVYVLKIHVLHPWAFALVLIISSLSFLFIVFALSKALGDAGRGIAMVLLAVQLSSSGAILPVELSGGLFAQISPWLPITWVVKSIKASMFGAYGGAWGRPMIFVLLLGLAAFALSCAVGRWRFVPSPTKRSVIDA